LKVAQCFSKTHAPDPFFITYRILSTGGTAAGIGIAVEGFFLSGDFPKPPAKRQATLLLILLVGMNAYDSCSPQINKSNINAIMCKSK
jgi:hypothetical protein